MWETSEIQVLFSLCGASPDVLEAVKRNNLTHENMDTMSVKDLFNMGITSKNVCNMMITQWKSLCSNKPPAEALETIETAMVSYGQVLAFKEERNQAMCMNVQQDAVHAIKHGQLLRIIREQDSRIAELESREAALVEELDKRASIIQDQETHMVDLEEKALHKLMTADDVANQINMNHSLLHEKIDETKGNVSNIDKHVSSILKMAQHTVDIIREEERTLGFINSSREQEQDSTCRWIRIDQISLDSLTNEGGDVSVDSFVSFKVGGAETVETKTHHDCGTNPSPTWEHLDIGLQALDDDSNEDNNKLLVEVWDSFSMNVSNKLLCSGAISFAHLDMLHNRGVMKTSVDLFDSTDTLVTVAQLHISVLKGGSDPEHSRCPDWETQFGVNDDVLCNFGAEGEWLPGRISRVKKIRDGSLTTRVYEVEFVTGDVEVHVPASRLKRVTSTQVQAAEVEGKVLSTQKGEHAGDTQDCKETHFLPEDDMAALIQSSSAALLGSITDVQKESEGTIASIKELDDWQRKLTKLLSDALKRYLDISLSARKYSVFVNSLTEKIGSSDHFLQRLQLSEQNNDDLNAECDKLRKEIEDLRRQCAELKKLHDEEMTEHGRTKHLLAQEKEVTLDCKKEIIDLRSELDHLVEVVRRDMSKRITNKNVNEELYSLSSNMVKTDSFQISNVSNSNTVLQQNNTTTGGTEHDDMFMQQHDWKLYSSLMKENMSAQEVDEVRATLLNLHRSFDILSSRLVLECRHRAECEFKLTGAKDNLRQIRDSIISEGTLRLQLEEEMQYFKETAENSKAEVEKHKKRSLIAKKAACDAINQVRHLKKNLHSEGDTGSDAGVGESKGSVNQEDHEHRGSKRGSPANKSTKSSSKKSLTYEEYNDLFEDTDDDEASARGRPKLSRSSTERTPHSPYLRGGSKKPHRKSHPYLDNLHTRSLNERDFHSQSQASHSVASSKKSKRIKMPGKKQMTYLGKKVSRVLFDKGGSSAGVAPFDGKIPGKSRQNSERQWVKPGFVDYNKKYSKEPPTAASRRAYVPQQHPE